MYLGHALWGLKKISDCCSSGHSLCLVLLHCTTHMLPPWLCTGYKMFLSGGLVIFWECCCWLSRDFWICPRGEEGYRCKPDFHIVWKEPYNYLIHYSWEPQAKGRLLCFLLTHCVKSHVMQGGEVAASDIFVVQCWWLRDKWGRASLPGHGVKLSSVAVCCAGQGAGASLAADMALIDL